MPWITTLARAQRWPGEMPDRAFLGLLRDQLVDRPGARVAVLGGPSAPVLARVLRRRFPGLRPVAVDPGADASTAHATLCGGNPYSLVVDVADGGAAEQTEHFLRTFLHLGRGGLYLARRVLPVTAEDVLPAERAGLDLAGLVERIRDTPYDRTAPEPVRDLACLGLCIVEVTRFGPTLGVRNQRRMRPKLRDSETNRVLTSRPGIGAVVSSRPGGRFASRCDYGDSEEMFPDHTRTGPNEAALRLPVFDVPPLHLRRYDAPICGRGQVVETQGLLLPDTFRHHRGRRLVHGAVADFSPWFGEVRLTLSDAEPLPGAYFHFDSEWPGHFGHTLSEQISRLWAFEEVRRAEPDVRLLTSLPSSRTDQRLQDWEVTLLEPYGVAADRVQVFDRSVRPERLYAATPMFSCPEYVHPGIVEVWDRIGRQLEASAPPRDRPARIFCSRRPTLKRACRNAGEVEAFFADRGFTVVYPEDHSLADQVAMFRSASAVAGFAGSALFTTAFCERPTTVLLLCPESYTARNEYLFASVRGHRLRVAWSRPDLAHPERGWSAEAFGSSFRVDLDREGRYVDRVIDELEGTPGTAPRGNGHPPVAAG